MSKWIDFTIDERKAMIQAVSEEKQDRRGICRKGLVGNGCTLCHIPYQHRQVSLVQRWHKP